MKGPSTGPRLAAIDYSIEMLFQMEVNGRSRFMQILSDSSSVSPGACARLIITHDLPLSSFSVEFNLQPFADGVEIEISFSRSKSIPLISNGFMKILD